MLHDVLVKTQPSVVDLVDCSNKLANDTQFSVEMLFSQAFRQGACESFLTVNTSNRKIIVVVDRNI